MRKLLGALLFVAGGLLGGANETFSNRDRSLASHMGVLVLAVFIMTAGVSIWKSSKSVSDRGNDEGDD